MQGLQRCLVTTHIHVRSRKDGRYRSPDGRCRICPLWRERFRAQRKRLITRRPRSWLAWRSLFCVRASRLYPARVLRPFIAFSFRSASIFVNFLLNDLSAQVYPFAGFKRGCRHSNGTRLSPSFLVKEACALRKRPVDDNLKMEPMVGIDHFIHRLRGQYARFQW